MVSSPSRQNLQVLSFSVDHLSLQIVLVEGAESISEACLLLFVGCFFYQDCESSWVECVDVSLLSLLFSRSRRNLYEAADSPCSILSAEPRWHPAQTSLFFISLSMFVPRTAEERVHPTGAPIGRVKPTTMRGHQVYHRLGMLELSPATFTPSARVTLYFRTGLKTEDKENEDHSRGQFIVKRGWQNKYRSIKLHGSGK